MQRDVATKLTAMTQTKVILWHLLMESCTMYLLFSVSVLTVGIFRHAFIHVSMDHIFSRLNQRHAGGQAKNYFCFITGT